MNEALPASSGAYDCDGDGFIGITEQYVFSAANTANDQKRCGVDAWQPDFNNDGLVDIMGMGEVAGAFGQAVPPAPARKNIVPGLPNGFVDISDLGAVAARFGTSCVQ